MCIRDRIKASKKPMFISGGGVRYSEAGETVMEFCKAFNIPVSQTCLLYTSRCV